MTEATEDETNKHPGGARRRGADLVILLFGYAGVVIGTGVAFAAGLLDEVEHGGEPTTVQILYPFALLLALIGVAGLWLWRKWGAWAFGFAAAAGLVLDISVGLTGLLVAARVVLAGALGFVLLPYWDRMTD